MSDEWIERLAGCKALSSIDLRSTKVSGRGLAALGRIPHLKGIELGEGIRDEDLKRLDAPELVNAFLGESNVTADGLKTLARMKHLQVLGINRRQIGDSLKSLPHLEILHIQRANDEQLLKLRGTKNLRLVVFGASLNVSDGACEELKRSIPGLLINL